MYSAIGVEPTKLTAFTRGSCSRVSPASLSPLTTFSTPGGRPASSASWAMNSVEEGSRSEGLSTKVFTRHGHGPHPQRHHGREVEGRDACGDAQRLELTP